MSLDRFLLDQQFLRGAANTHTCALKGCMAPAHNVPTAEGYCLSHALNVLSWTHPEVNTADYRRLIASQS